MASVLRREVYWADLEPQSEVVGHEQANRRPVLVLSHDRFNRSSRTVVVALITSSANRWQAVEIQSITMRYPSWVMPSQIRTLSVDRLQNRIGRLSEAEVDQVCRAVASLISL